MTLQEYYDELNKHDWYYEFSESGSVFDKGSRKEKELKKLGMTLGSDFMLLREAFIKHHFSGTSFNSEKQPKPKRPE